MSNEREVKYMHSNKIPEEISLPALLLDLSAFEENCRQIASYGNGKKIRIATKSIRSVEVIKRILDSSSVFQGVMCYSPEEAVFLVEKGLDDILIAYPCWDKKALSDISILNSKGKNIICMVDAAEHVDHLNHIAKETKGSFYLCIDVDMSTTFFNLHFGVRRSPLKDSIAVLELARKIKQLQNLELIGIMGYEAQIAGVGDKVPSQRLKNSVIEFLKKKSIKEVEERRNKVVHALRQEGFSLPLVNGGGTGSLDSTTKEDVVTEVAVGSGFYSPKLFDYYNGFLYKPALFYALPIVRKPAPNIYTCHGGGYVSSGPPGKDKEPQLVYPVGGKLLDLEGAGEVQTPVHYENATLEIGDAIIFRAAKAGEVCERFQEIVCLSDQQIVGRHKTYRGEGVCFI